jgi:hypothetical protein
MLSFTGSTGLTGFTQLFGGAIPSGIPKGAATLQNIALIV